ncbi:MAG: hypothetical protein ACK4HF_00225 [Paracoccaceae bacterium]
MDEKAVSSFAESEHPMNGASKILTVSYGTFSCTLEGFDDPFNTMKAIAEYFRDLAAGDRYFGAEPPQPDAAMLHRIAEREIQRRVEAKIQDNGVILRAEGNDAEAGARTAALPAVTAFAAAQPDPQPVVEMPARSSVAPAKPAPVLAQLEADTGSDAGTATESVAEKLSRLRKAAAERQEVAETAAVVTAAAPVMPPSDNDYTEDADDGSFEAPAAAPLLADEGVALPSGDATFDDPLPEDAEATAQEIVSGDLPPEAQSADGGIDEHATDAEDLAGLRALDAAHLDAAHSDDPGRAADVPATPDDDAPDHAEPVTSEPAHVAQDPSDHDESEAAMLAGLVEQTAVPDAGVPDAGVAEAVVAADDTASHAVAPATPDDGWSEDSYSDDALLASLGAIADADDQPAAPDAAIAAPAADDDWHDAGEPAVSGDDAELHDPVSTDLPPVEDDRVSDTDLICPEPETDSEDDPSVAEIDDIQFDTDAEPASAAAEPDAPAAQPAPQHDTAEIAAPAPVTPVRPVRPVRVIRPTVAERPAAPTAVVAGLSSDTSAEVGSRPPITVEKLQRARARVIKIRRNETLAPAPTALSQEAEAALAAELAALEQDLPAATLRDPATAAPKSDPSPDHRLGLRTEDVAVSRLMAEASTQMEVPDTKRRQSAIAHLKAAVAATIAERRATGSTLAGNGSERLGAYRDDLAKVVRPSTGAGAVPGERPAPLVLVSEQRIDRPADTARTGSANVQPVRAQRPMTSAAPALASGFDLDVAYEADDEAGNIFEDESIREAGSSFPDFAERLGATDLPALLEAAAAYIACVEGRDSFTRPQLMRHIDAAAEGLSREDGLRSFGTLLRDGVIERSRRGQFAISETSPLLAEARKIAG